jgi:hypothetical protein
LFVPPIGAKELANCSDKLQAPKALQTPNPEYPKNEPQPNSPVVISLIVGVDGEPRDLRVARLIGKAFEDRHWRQSANGFLSPQCVMVIQ